MQVARIIKKMPSDLECHLSQVNWSMVKHSKQMLNCKIDSNYHW
jgi:hypothetical protein